MYYTSSCVVFIGVGQVVVQISALVGCKCYGIEKADIPAKYAEVSTYTRSTQASTQNFHYLCSLILGN